MCDNKIKKTKVIRIFEAFAGMGAQRKALENIGAKYEVSGMAEWYVPAIISYQAIHNNFNLKNLDFDASKEDMVNYLESKTLSVDSKEPVKKGYWKRKREEELRVVYSAVKMSEDEGNIFDVRTLHQRTLKNIDLLTYSFPCQDLSQQGKQQGMTKGAKTRSGLLWEIEKSLESTPKKQLPTFLLMENVMALEHKKNQSDLSAWIRKLESLGYTNHKKIINSANFGSAQARRRVFMISSLKKNIKLPQGEQSPKPIKKILNKKLNSNDVMEKLSGMKLTEGRGVTKSNIKKWRLPLSYTSFNSEAYVYDPNYTGPTLTASGANSRIKILHNNKIRKLNALEAYKYMGFSSEDYYKVSKLNILSNNKMIYTCGNSISVEVLESIFKEIR